MSHIDDSLQPGASGESNPDRKLVWARGRRLDCTYIHRSFTILNRFSRDFGQQARYIVRVFEEDGGSEAGLDWEEHLVKTTPAGRKQLKLLVARERGRVKELVLEDVPTSGGATKVRTLLHLRREHAMRLVDVIRALDSIPVEGEYRVRLDDDILNALLREPQAVEQIYSRDPESFREAIQNDENARDLAALVLRDSVPVTSSWSRRAS